MTYLPDTTKHIPKFGSEIWYVNNSATDDTGPGTDPDTAFKTIGAGLTAASAGDAIVITAGTYTETGLDVDKNNIELWFEIGAIIAPASGTALTISADYCRVICREGALSITPAAGETGVEISGIFCYLAEIRVACSSSALIGFDITGNGADLRRCRCSAPLTAAFKIQGNKIKLEDCCTGGESGDSSIGYWITNSCDKTRLINCGSQGHETSGYQVDSGCTNVVASNCHSGGGDGDRIDNGNFTHWPKFEGVSHKEEHYHCYPTTNGEGTAGAPISVTSDAADETHAAATTQDYYGEPKVILPITQITNLWSWFGVNVFANTALKIFDLECLRINYTMSSAKNGGNAWDEGATSLTVADGSVFETGDLVWIYSDYKTDGEIVRITNVSTNVITIEREGSQWLADNTGLRWDHTTNNAGTEEMYLVYREGQWGMHDTNLQISFASTKDSITEYFSNFRSFNANDGLLARLVNMTDSTNAGGLDVSIIYREGGH